MITEKDNSVNCSECGGVILTEPHIGQSTCTNCGLVHSESEIQDGSGLKEYVENMPNRWWARKEPFKSKNLRRVILSSVANRMINTTKEKNAKGAKVRMSMVGHKLGLSKAIINLSFRVYNNAIEKGLGKGRALVGILGGGLVYGCRVHGAPYSFTEVGDVLGCGKLDVAKGYSLLVRELELKLPNNKETYLKLIIKVCSDVGANVDVQKEVLSKYKSMVVLGNPRCTIASLIYQACGKEESLIELGNKGNKITQEVIANAVGVTTCSLRNHVKKMEGSDER